MIGKINFQELQSIYILSKALNMQAAARALNLPKSSLQKHLESVEKKLDAKLFERSQRSGAMALTSFGKETLPKIQNILWLADSLSDLNKFSKDKHNVGRYRLSPPKQFWKTIFALCEGLLANHKKLSLSLRQKDENYYSQPNVNEISISGWEGDMDTYAYFPFTPIHRSFGLLRNISRMHPLFIH